jgi:hypothetical protein
VELEVETGREETGGKDGEELCRDKVNVGWLQLTVA